MGPKLSERLPLKDHQNGLQDPSLSGDTSLHRLTEITSFLYGRTVPRVCILRRMLQELGFVSYGLLPTARGPAPPEDDDSSCIFHTSRSE